MINIKDIRSLTGMTQKEFAEYFKIPKRTIESWEEGKRTPPEYVIDLMRYKLAKENLLI